MNEEDKLKKAEQQALIIEQIKFHLQLLDIDFCKQAASDMREQASRQETLSVLNPNYDFKRSELLRVQAEALQLIAEFKESLIKAQKLKDEIGKRAEQINEISKMFI